MICSSVAAKMPGWAAVSVGRLKVVDGGVLSHYHDLHDGAGVRPVTRQGRGRAAGIGLIRVARVVIGAGVERRHRRGRVVIQDQGLAGKLGEVHHDVRALSRSDQQTVGPDIQDRDAAALVFVVGRGGGDHHRGGQQAAFGADLDEWAGPQ